MKLTFLTLPILFFINTFAYALTCDTTYQGHPFKRVVISLQLGDVRCKYYFDNTSDEIGYTIGDGFLDSYVPSAGNWLTGTPRFWECKVSSDNCEFEKL